MIRRTMALAAALVLTAAAAGADEVYLRGGRTLRGEVKEIREKSLVMSVEGIAGSRVEIPLTEISDFGLYELKRARLDPGSAGAHEALGDWSIERGLFAFAMEEYAAAAKLAGDGASAELLKKLEDASARCGRDKLDRGDRLVAEGNRPEAIRYFRNILEEHPTCPAAGAAKERIEILKREIEAERKAAEAATAAEEETREVEEVLALVEELEETGDRMRKLGYLDSGSFGRAEDDFLAAIAAYERARDLLDRLEKRPGTAGRQAEVRKARTDLTRRLIDVYVDIGHNYVVKGNLVKANHYMGLALSLDPNDPKALALRQAIAYATGNDRWGRSPR